MTTVGFVGLGNMGSALAANLVRSVSSARGRDIGEAAVEWQSAALVRGLTPVGLVVGRWFWRVFAEDLGVVVVPVVPTAA